MTEIYSKKEKFFYPPKAAREEGLALFLGIARAENGFLHSSHLVLYNYSPHRMGFEIRNRDPLQLQLSDTLDSQEGLTLYGMEKEKIQSGLRLNIAVAAFQTDRAAPNYQSYSSKIQPKHFVKNTQPFAPLNMELRWLGSFTGIPQPQEKLKVTATERTQKAAHKVDPHDPFEKAQFPRTLDLHAHALFRYPSNYTKEETFIEQLKAFEKYLDRAIVLGIDKVTINHGIGKGRLKEEIARRLSNHHQVRDYKNEFTEKHKFGATEVFF